MAALLGFAVCAATAPARADILPNDAPPAPPVVITPVGVGLWDFTYNVFVTDTQQVNVGDRFTFFDFGGYVLGSATSSAPNWTFTETLVGPDLDTPFGDLVVPGDSASLWNITFTYQGPGMIIGAPTSLGNFTLRSTLNENLVFEPFGGNGTDQNTGLPNGNVSNYLSPTAVPEPGEYAFGLIFGGGMIGLMLRARRRNAANA